MGCRAPVRTHDAWDRPPLGFLEIDLVAPGSGLLVGSVIHRQVATEVCTGWTGAVSTSGQGTAPGGRGAGSRWSVDPASDNAHRLGQRRRLHQRDANKVVRGTRHRVQSFQGLRQERPGVGRAEEGRCGAPPRGASPERPTVTGRCGPK